MLPVPKSNNVVDYHASLARMSQPKGANHHKPAKSRLWTYRGTTTDSGVTINRSGQISGDGNRGLLTVLDAAEQAIRGHDIEKAEALLEYSRGLTDGSSANQQLDFWAAVRNDLNPKRWRNPRRY